MNLYKDYIYKQAALNSNVRLYPHQQRVVDNPSNELIIAHSVGSGKTLTGIAKFEKLKQEGRANKALVVVPAGLRTNFAEQGIGKFTDSKYNIVGNGQERRKKIYGGIDPNADYNVISYEMFRRNPKQYILESGADTVITDESHRSKNEGTQTVKAFKNTRDLYKNYIGLTGSVISNSIADVQPLIDVASNGNHNLGKSKNEFEKKYLKRSTDKAYRDLVEKRRPVVGFKNKRDLEKELLKHLDYVDYQDIKEIANMPDKKVNIVKVPLTKEQAKAYKQTLKDDPKIRQLITRKRLETMKNEEIANAFSTLIEQRKLMNSANTVIPGMSLEESFEKTPKTKRAVNDVVNHLKTTPDGQALILTHLVNGGVDVVEAGLKKNNIPYGKFVGKNKNITEEMRQQDVRDFNDRKKRVMIISPAGNEGLSLNDTTFEAVLDPHFNPEKMNQMEARGIRSGGLSHRPKEERVVNVDRYIATMPKTLGVLPDRTPTPDEFIYEIAQNKDKNNQMFFKYLKRIRNKSERNKKMNPYKEQIEKVAMEKVAVAAWKKHIGTLSDASRKILENKKILDYEKNIKGLRRGTANIANKYNVKVVRKPNKAGAYAGSLVKADAKKQGIKVDKGTVQSFIDDAKSSPHSQINPHTEPVKGLGNKTGYSYVPKNQRKQFEADTGVKPLKGKLNKRYEQALTERHEVDEARYQTQALKNKKKRAIDKDGGVGALTDFRGHNSPKVLARESQNAAVAPKEVRRYMESARGGAGEMHDLRKGGIVYGRSGEYQRNAANKMEKAQIPKNARKFYKANNMETPDKYKLKQTPLTQPQTPKPIKPSTTPTTSNTNSLYNSSGKINLTRNNSNNIFANKLHNSNGTINLKRNIVNQPSPIGSLSKSNLHNSDGTINLTRR